MKVIKTFFTFRYLKIYAILASAMFLHCTLLQPFTVDEGSQYNYKLGTLKLYMPDKVEDFIRITPQSFFSKSIIFNISAQTIFNGKTTNYEHVRMNLHGESTLKYPRKSLELQFDKEDYFFNYPIFLYFLLIFFYIIFKKYLIFYSKFFNI